MNVLYFDYRGSWGPGGEFSSAIARKKFAPAISSLHSPKTHRRFSRNQARTQLVDTTIIIEDKKVKQRNTSLQTKLRADVARHLTAAVWDTDHTFSHP